MAHSGYLGEIRIFAFNFLPPDYIICDGKRLNKSQHQQLYTVLGDVFTYDRSDPSTFAIPDLRNRFIKHPGTDLHLGEQKGEDEVVLTLGQMPEHNHDVALEVDNTNGGDEGVPKPNQAYLNNNAHNFSIDASADTYLGGISQQNVGNSEPVPIKNEYVKMVFAIRYKNPDPVGGFLGEIRIWPNSKTGEGFGSIPSGWKLCNGDTYSIGANPALGTIIGFKYGTDTDGNPKLPDFRNKFASGARVLSNVAETGGNTSVKLVLNNLPTHKHNLKLAVNNDTESVETPLPTNAFINKNAGAFSQEITSQAALGGIDQKNAGGKEELDITNSCLGLNYIISVEGNYKPNSELTYTGEIILYAGSQSAHLANSGFTTCDGLQLDISQYQSLYALIQNFYGGDGPRYYKLPDLRHKSPICVSSLNEVGISAGANKIKLSPENLPAHNHDVKLAANHTGSGRRVEIPDGILNNDAGPYSIKETENTYLAGIKEHDFTRDAEAIDIRNPFLTINYLICVKGTFPSRGPNNN
jgi:microcystin-dependent protein